MPQILKIWMHLLDSLFSADLLTLQISNVVRWWFFSCSCASLSCEWWWCSLCGGFSYCKINVDSFGWFWYFQALLSSAINGSLAEIWSLNSPDVFVTATLFSNQRVSMVHKASNLHESSTTLLEEGSAQLPSSGEFSGSGSAVFLEELDREWELDQTRSALRDSRLRSEDENREGLSSTFYFESEREVATTGEPENPAFLSWVTWSAESESGSGSGQGGSVSSQSDDIPIQLAVPQLTLRESDQSAGKTHTWRQNNMWRIKNMTSCVILDHFTGVRFTKNGNDNAKMYFYYFLFWPPINIHKSKWMYLRSKMT